MFDESERGSGGRGERGRLAASLMGSVVLYGALGAGAVAATAAVRNVVVDEKLVQVEFVPPPEVDVAPPPPAPAPKQRKLAPPGKRAKAVRESMEAPKEIPDTTPAESGDALVEGEPGGPVEGFLDGEGDGAGGGTDAGDAPGVVTGGGARSPEVVERPAAPEYPVEAREERIEGLVYVRCIVSAQGTNEACRAIRGHALLRETAVTYVARFRMAPARGDDGEPLRVAQVFPVRFMGRNL